MNAQRMQMYHNECFICSLILGNSGNLACDAPMSCGLIMNASMHEGYRDNAFIPYTEAKERMDLN